MPFKIHTMEQGSPEWFDIKRGKFSASNFGKLMSNTSTKGWNDLINQIVYERFTGKSVEHYINEAMLKGSELEPEARADYEFVTGNKVEQVGFIELDEWVGVSPDGLIGEDGLLEIKCPQWNTHLDYKQRGGIPSIYQWQLQGQLYVTGRKWVDFYSYHPELPSHLFREYRNEGMVEELEERLTTSIQEVDKRLNKLKEK